MEPDQMNERLDLLRCRFRPLGVANFLVTRMSNVRYLCGFTGSNGILFVTRRDAYFITDGRYTNQAQEQVKGAQVFTYHGGGTMSEAFIREVKSNKEIRFRGRIGIEAQFMSVDFFQTLRRVFPGSHTIETELVVEDISAVKDDVEIDAIRRAVKITDEVFNTLLTDIKPGVSEMDLSAEISYRQRKLGAEKDAFETIVASGPRSALPHGIASNRKIEKDDFVTFDFGCIVDGYPSDMTRTVVVGKASRKQREIYDLVKEAQAAAVDAIQAGTKCSDVDNVARQIIAKGGYGDRFTHGLGHGLGLEVHGRPVLSRISNTKLKPGMVVTVEPGIYIDGFGGVRIEDDVLVTSNGHDNLTQSPRELIEL